MATAAALPMSQEDRRNMLSEGCNFDRGPAAARENGLALVFASTKQLEILLRNATHVYFDATFKVVPTINYHLFTMLFHTLTPHFRFFMFSCLARLGLTVWQCFEYFKKLVPQFTLSSAVADLDKVFVSGFERVRSTSPEVGCVTRKRQSQQDWTAWTLKDAYQRNNDVRDTPQRPISLPLIPVSDIIVAVDVIRQSSNVSSLSVGELTNSKTYTYSRYYVH
jgi:hypothetical protein